MSGAEHSMEKLFARAAALLRGEELSAAGDHDAEYLLRALDYSAVAPGSHWDPRKRESRLLAHGRFAIRAGIRTRCARRAGTDLLWRAIRSGTRRFRCIREARSSAFPASVLRCRKHFRAASARGSSISLNCKPKAICCSNRALNDCAGKLGPMALELVAILSERRTQPERALSWFRATRSTDGSEVLLPADICLRRPPAQREFTPPFPLSIGSAAGPSREAAALHGLLELIERDAAALWWRGGQFGRSIPPQHEAGIAGRKSVAAAPARRGVAAPDLVARYYDGCRRALCRGRLLPGGWFRFCLRPRGAAKARGRGALRDYGDVPTRIGRFCRRHQAQRARGWPHSIRRIALTCGAR